MCHSCLLISALTGMPFVAARKPCLAALIVMLSVGIDCVISSKAICLLPSVSGSQIYLVNYVMMTTINFSIRVQYCFNAMSVLPLAADEKPERFTAGPNPALLHVVVTAPVSVGVNSKKGQIIVTTFIAEPMYNSQMLQSLLHCLPRRRIAHMFVHPSALSRCAMNPHHSNLDHSGCETCL